MNKSELLQKIIDRIKTEESEKATFEQYVEEAEFRSDEYIDSRDDLAFTAGQLNMLHFFKDLLEELE